MVRQRTDGTGFSQLTDLPGFNACPAYSPDGKSIAFCDSVVTGPGQGVIEIWAMKANGKKRHQVTHLGGFATRATFS